MKNILLLQFVHRWGGITPPDCKSKDASCVEMHTSELNLPNHQLNHYLRHFICFLKIPKILLFNSITIGHSQHIFVMVK